MWASARVGQGNNTSAATAGIIRIFNLHNTIPLLWKYDVVYIYSHTEKKPAFLSLSGHSFVLHLGNQRGIMNALPDSIPRPSAAVTPQSTELSSVLCFFTSYVLLSRFKVGFPQSKQMGHPHQQRRNHCYLRILLGFQFWAHRKRLHRV